MRTQLGMIGLGRMGGNMARRLLRAGHAVVGWDRSEAALRAAVEHGVTAAASLDDLVARLAAPRAVWLMLPAGGPTEDALAALAPLLSPGDALVDGGNAHWRDDVRRAAALDARGIRYLDVGTSGGVWGLERGYCLMVGGDRSAFERLEPVWRALAPGSAAAPPTPGRARGGAEEGYLHCGAAGAGHFVKMIHNGIEYALMQAYAEGFDLLRGASAGLPDGVSWELDVGEIAELWRRGSVVSSWLLDLAAAALAADPALDRWEGRVADSGEGRWTLEAAIAEGVPANALAAALFARFRSRRDRGFGDRLLSAMRHQFGGHGEAPEGGAR